MERWIWLKYSDTHRSFIHGDGWWAESDSVSTLGCWCWSLLFPVHSRPRLYTQSLDSARIVHWDCSWQLCSFLLAGQELSHAAQSDGGSTRDRSQFETKNILGFYYYYCDEFRWLEMRCGVASFYGSLSEILINPRVTNTHLWALRHQVIIMHDIVYLHLQNKIQTSASINYIAICTLSLQKSSHRLQRLGTLHL